MKNLENISQALQKRDIPVPAYIDKYQTLEVYVIGEYNENGENIILCRIEENGEWYYQDFYYNHNENCFKILSEYLDVFKDWWIEEDIYNKISNLPGFRHFVYEKANFDYVKHRRSQD